MWRALAVLQSVLLTLALSRRTNKNVWSYQKTKMFDISLPLGSVQNLGMYIGGCWLPTGARDLIEVENPADESVLASIPAGTREDADEAIIAAHAAFAAWSGLPSVERAALVSALADAITANTETLASLVTREQGKPISEARGEVGATVTFLRYAAESARRIEGDIIVSDFAEQEIQIRRHPYGVVVGLTAWNYPLALAARKLGPALVAGNTFVLLAHELTPLSGLAIAKLSHDVGFPPGVINVVTGRGPVIGQAMVEHPKTALVTMTGSTRAGREIYRAGAEGIKVVRLELGGKAPFIVMEDADIDKAVEAAVVARFTNGGQICTCNERMYLADPIADQFLEKFIHAASRLTVGNPLGSVDLGPKVSRVERDKVAELVRRSSAAGAETLLEGGILEHGQYAKGHWLSPTVLEARGDVPALQEEIFGPVAVARRVSGWDEAVAHANDTAFGLSAFVFTKDYRRLHSAPYQLKFGEIYFNRANGEAVQGFHTGWGISGLGGEDGRYGFDNYLRKQTSYVSWA